MKVFRSISQLAALVLTADLLHVKPVTAGNPGQATSTGTGMTGQQGTPSFDAAVPCDTTGAGTGGWDFPTTSGFGTGTANMGTGWGSPMTPSFDAAAPCDTATNTDWSSMLTSGYDAGATKPCDTTSGTDWSSWWSPSAPATDANTPCNTAGTSTSWTDTLTGWFGGSPSAATPCPSNGGSSTPPATTSPPATNLPPAVTFPPATNSPPAVTSPPATSLPPAQQQTKQQQRALRG